MEILHELKELGMDENEIKVYLSCLKESGLTVKEIAKKTELIRTTVYGVLKSLSQKGLISRIDKEGILVFHAASPKELIELLDRKKSRIQSILPLLEKYSKQKEEKYKAELFEGRNGIKTLTNDIISLPDQTIKVIGVGKKWLEFSETFTSIYYRKKKEMNVRTKTILVDNREEREFAKEKKIKNSEIRFIKNLDFGNTTTYIYHDKVSFVAYDEDNPRGIIIQDKEFKRIQEMVFDRLWSDAGK